MAEQPQPDDAGEKDKLVRYFNSEIAAVLQRLSAEMLPGSETDDRIEEFLAAMRISLASHFAATVLCSLRDDQCFQCSTLMALDEILDTHGDEIVQHASAPMAVVH